MTIRDAQQLAWANKLAKGFNTTDVPLEFCFLQREAGEAFDAWRKGLPDLDDELADVVLFAVSLAAMTGIDLQDAVERKLAKNAGRTYVTGPNGYPVRMDEPSAAGARLSEVSS
jgi:NTP pyrophosphatase (non-canonical NTP hydrolase)